jgi:mannose-6-phosphate isomerase-like protein (cupin superfamily)
MVSKSKTYFGLTYKATGKETNGSYFFSETIIPAGDYGPPLHYHINEDEGFYIIEGNLTFVIDDKEIKLKTGEFINIPKGVKHTWKNTSSKDTKMNVIFSPAGIEKMFIELDKLISNEQSNFSISLIKIGRKYGTEFLLDKL